MTDSTIKCPYCGSTETEKADDYIYTSNPPKTKHKCKSCGKHFFHGETLQDAPSYSAALETKLDENISLNGGKVDSNTYTIVSPGTGFICKQGWQCPKCGSILAPHMDYCIFCSPGYMKPTWGSGSGDSPTYPYPYITCTGSQAKTEPLNKNTIS